MESGHVDRGCRQEEALIGYLYNECEPEEHARLEAHLATAAVVVLLVGAVLASVEVRYGDDGSMFVMGWSGRTDVEGAPAPKPAIASVEPASDAAPATVEVGATPWRADLMVLENQLRREMVASARDGRRVPVPRTLTLRIRGRDLAAIRTGELSPEEARARVEIP